MAIPAGWNPLRWQCDKDGCFNVKRRPKIEAFADCFPGRINFGDVDGLVELRGAFCLLEWKGDGGSLRTAQRIAFEAFTRQHFGNVVYVVNGSAETMEAQSFCRFWNGKCEKTRSADLDAVKASIKGWVRWVQHPEAPKSVAA